MPKIMLKFEAEKNPSKWKNKSFLAIQGPFFGQAGGRGKTLGHIWLTSSLLLHAVHPRRGAADVFGSKNGALTLQGRLI